MMTEWVVYLEAVEDDDVWALDSEDGTISLAISDPDADVREFLGVVGGRYRVTVTLEEAEE
jgi:hypothetical protein